MLVAKGKAIVGGLQRALGPSPNQYRTCCEDEFHDDE
eukprot:CAMPEP_0196720976 /NCGR_PEP_ID=MMETSP1091-20130531/3658_1 /TAXON_ID=302021 /ORGANISM="Rhodomonas sp., Strain CCMP768" /LENGTH=36 /DNA_ID= /DNA_START= /DNA_END= /DNA_ORIENTATION=